MKLMGQMLKQLQEEKEAIDTAIASLEEVLRKQNGGRAQPARGAGKEPKAKENHKARSTLNDSSCTGRVPRAPQYCEAAAVSD